MEVLRYLCIDGFTINKRLMCTTGDEVILDYSFNSDKEVNIKGVKGYCKDWEFSIPSDIMAKNFVLL